MHTRLKFSLMALLPIILLTGCVSSQISLFNGQNLDGWVNHAQMIDLTDAKIGAGKGAIALQVHNGSGIHVRWRNLKLKKL